MTLAVAYAENIYYTHRSPGVGEGENGINIHQILNDVFSYGRQSGLRELTRQALLEIYRDYSKENWDGEGAIAIGEDAYLEAREFIRLLPTTLPLPEVLPEPTGEIAFEWYKSKTHLFVVSFRGRGIITYAGMFGEGTTIHGTERFEDFIPKMVIENMRRLLPLPD